MRYAIRIRKDSNDTFLVIVPDLPDAITFGETLEVAKLQAVDAIETAMMARMTDREAIPQPSATGCGFGERDVAEPSSSCRSTPDFRSGT